MGISIEEIELAVENFSPEEFSKFSEWFEEFEEKVWDRKITQDLENGKLQALISEAERDQIEGNFQEL